MNHETTQTQPCVVEGPVTKSQLPVNKFFLFCFIVCDFHNPADDVVLVSAGIFYEYLKIFTFCWWMSCLGDDFTIVIWETFLGVSKFYEIFFGFGFFRILMKYIFMKFSKRHVMIIILN